MTCIQDQYERTCCDCDICKAGCKTMPAPLAPGDIDAIANHLGVEADESFIGNNFRASEGSQVWTKKGRKITLHTIVPAQHEDGRCVFLGSKDQCTIHEVSPFGCSRFSLCNGSPSKGDYEHDMSLAHLEACHNSFDYQMLWKWLHARGKLAGPADARRQAKFAEISRIKDEGHARKESVPPVEASPET